MAFAWTHHKSKDEFNGESGDIQGLSVQQKPILSLGHVPELEIWHGHNAELQDSDDADDERHKTGDLKAKR